MSFTVDAAPTVILDLDTLDIADPVVVAAGVEQVDLGGSQLNGTYLRIRSADLVATAEALQRLGVRLVEAALDARSEWRDEQRHPCVCGELIDPDEHTCGRRRCVIVEAS